jgi:hypothetical protein
MGKEPAQTPLRRCQGNPLFSRRVSGSCWHKHVLSIILVLIVVHMTSFINGTKHFLSPLQGPSICSFLTHKRRFIFDLFSQDTHLLTKRSQNIQSTHTMESSLYRIMITTLELSARYCGGMTRMKPELRNLLLPRPRH